ncbi:alpha-hydroxy acid oxidase [Nocardioides halotolerans]|uniref:alpha-hydroxy acid oxidase n=1 Tax=Nocardioides halotolerans TaxID=433660 RepID=UPI00041DF237|nr:alpha-hydroxy acid oxidase [Nocardioides halotolerans]
MTWLAELEERARASLTAPVLEYVATGAREGVSAREAGWADVRFLPHVLRDVTDVSLGTTLLGGEAEVPWGVAPSTLQRAVHPEGEVAMARACAAAGSVLVVSSNAGTPFAEIGATGVRWWLQAYLPADRTLAQPMLERAVAAGAEAVVLTVDTPVVATKYAAGEQVIWDVVDPQLLRVNFDPGYDDRPGAEKATDLGPHDLGWLAEVSGLPVVVKGVLRGDDARRCAQAGASAVWVSNHGGRQLDRAVRTSAALAGVVEEVGADVDVYVDGGVRSGLDVLAALALGADAVFLGRLPLWALVEGEPGVARMHADLRAEVTEAFRLGGCRTVADARGIAVLPERP